MSSVFGIGGADDRHSLERSIHQPSIRIPAASDTQEPTVTITETDITPVPLVLVTKWGR